MSNKKKQLKEEVAQKFVLKGIAEAGEVNHPVHGLIDLSSVGLAKAEKLAADPSFRFLQAKPKVVEKQSSKK